MDVILGLGQGLVAPLGNDGVVKHLLMPVGFICESVHQDHHGHFANLNQLRLRERGAFKRAQAVEVDAGVTALLEVPQREVHTGIFMCFGRHGCVLDETGSDTGECS